MTAVSKYLVRVALAASWGPPRLQSSKGLLSLSSWSLPPVWHVEAYFTIHVGLSNLVIWHFCISHQMRVAPISSLSSLCNTFASIVYHSDDLRRLRNWLKDSFLSRVPPVGWFLSSWHCLHPPVSLFSSSVFILLLFFLPKRNEFTWKQESVYINDCAFWKRSGAFVFWFTLRV